MKVLHLFKTYLPESFTGIERVIWAIAEGTAPLGVESKVLTLSAHPGAGPLVVGHHEVHQAKLDLYVASTGLSLSAFGRFRELAADADVIHYHFPWPLMDLLHLIHPPGRPAILTYHSDVIRQKSLLKLYGPLMHWFLGRVDRIIATSPDYVHSSPVLRRYADKVATIPIGLPEAEVPPTTELDRWRARIGDGFFLFVGALRYYKGIQFLIEAARLTGLPVVIAGDGELRGEIEGANLPNVTLVSAFTDADKEALLSLCRAFVFPSHLRSEAFGVALLEAARAARPMISCEIGTGTSYVNVDGETGSTIPPADPAALAAAMLQIWNDPDRAKEMGHRARARYESLFTADRMAKSYHDEYERLIDNAGSVR